MTVLRIRAGSPALRAGAACLGAAALLAMPGASRAAGPAAPSGYAGPGSTITVVAGSGETGNSGDGGRAVDARLLPEAVAVDALGNVFITDSFWNTIRKVTPDGLITTLVSSIQSPTAIAVDGQGILYVSGKRTPLIGGPDPGIGPGTGGEVYRVLPQGVVSPFAGLVGGPTPATNFDLHSADGLAVDGKGNLFIASDAAGRVYRVDTGGQAVETVAGSGQAPLAGIGVPVTDIGDGGPATGDTLFRPYSVAVDANENIYIGDLGSQDISAPRIRKVTPNGHIATVAGGGSSPYGLSGIPATSAVIASPRSLAADAQGNVFIANKLAVSGDVLELSGSTLRLLAGGVGWPFGVAVGPTGDVFATNELGRQVIRISRAPALTARLAVRLPSARSCVRDRAFRIRIRHVRGVTYRSATVSVDGRRVPVYVYGARRVRVTTIAARYLNTTRSLAIVDLRGLVRRAFTVKVRLTTTTGDTVTAARTFHTCAGTRLTGVIPR